MKRTYETAVWALTLSAILIYGGMGTRAEAHRILGPDGKPIPHWVRYPFEWQLCGISIGDRLLDRVSGNVISRYALIRVHGMPDGLVIGRSATSAQLPPGGGGGAGGAGAGPGGPGGAGPGGPQVFQQGEGAEGAPTLGAAPGGASPQQAAGGGATGEASAPAPAWATAAWIVLDGNHVEWLYRRDSYVMGFMVDHLGFIDGIVVAGTKCPIARTQMANPAHCIKLGDDARKVMYRYGFPDGIDTFVSSGGAPDAGAGGGVQLPGSATVTFRTVTNELRKSYLYRYEDSYNVIFTIQDNKVVRINIWGDPDYFTTQRKAQLRAEKY